MSADVIGLGNETEDGRVWVVSIVRHKHDGALMLPGTPYRMEKHRVAPNVKGGLIHAVGTNSPDWWGAAGRDLSPLPQLTQPSFTTEEQPDALRIVAGCGYDPGSQGMRLHSAINRHTKHASLFVRWEDTNPYTSHRQLDGEQDKPTVRDAICEADVIHCHVNYMLMDNVQISRRPEQLLIRHYHGSREGSTWVETEKDAIRGALILCARLQFHQDREITKKFQRRDFNFEWLPITIPVDDYLSLRAETPYTPGAWRFRVAHSPTRRNVKRTGVLIQVIERMQARGLDIELVLQENMPLGEALISKSTCDAVFDSFWLGIATSGLEGAAMRMPVVAGDTTARDLYNEYVGYCPYTFADNADELEQTLERLMTDDAFYRQETERVHNYTREYHDFPAVARRYESIVARALNRPDVVTSARRPQIVEPPKPQTPESPKVETHRPTQPEVQKPTKTKKRKRSS